MVGQGQANQKVRSLDDGPIAENKVKWTVVNRCAGIGLLTAQQLNVQTNTAVKADLGKYFAGQWRRNYRLNSQNSHSEIRGRKEGQDQGIFFEDEDVLSFR